jgi:hypothetical protein|tara:strand:- start:455 stop:1252 length:798 start_codon:yes stop_codon:yes gene_type:complete
MSTSTVAASASVRARARPRASRPPRASPSSDLRDVERDVANEGAARVRVSRAFIADLDADAPRRALEYVSLPANEYNLIDPENVTHDASGGFVVSAGRQRLLFLDVEPRGTVRVDAREDGNGCVQTLVGAEIVNLKPTDGRSAKVIDAVNASLKDLRLRNEVTATTSDDGARDAIKCQIDVAGDFREGVFARAGGRLNTVLGWSLGAVMPWFLTQLAADYGRWSRNEPRVNEDASLARVASEIIAGSRGRLPPGVRECECAEVEV